MSRDKVVIRKKITTRKKRNGKTYQHESRVSTEKLTGLSQVKKNAKR